LPRCGVTEQLQHPEYPAHWLKVPKEDNKAIFRAAVRCAEAADYLFELQRRENPAGDGPSPCSASSLRDGLGPLGAIAITLRSEDHA
jgi:antirestriction protein ArdC